LNQRFRRGLGLTVAALLFIGWLTLRPSPDDAEAAARSPFTCLVGCGDQGLRDAILNVMLFLPLGLALGWWLPARRLRSWLLTVALSCAIEFCQYHWLLGRDASLRDILTNSAGGALGIWLASGWRGLLFPDPRRSARLAALAAALWLGVVGATAIAVQPSLPISVYFGQWQPDLGQFDTWTGVLLDATVGSMPLPHGRLGDSRPLRAELLRDTALVTARIVSGPPTERVADIASVYDDRQREIFMLGEAGGRLVFRIRTGLGVAGLRDPAIILSDSPVREPGETLQVQGGVVSRAWVLRAGTARRRLAMSPGIGWSGLLPFEHPLGGLTGLANAVWLGGLLFPAGFWLGAGRRGRLALFLLLGIVAIGLGVLAPAAGLAVAPWGEWAGSVAGGLAGWRVSRLAARILAAG
jgi:VanZ like family